MVLEIIGIVLAVLVLITVVILLLPVRLFLYFDENGDFRVLCRVLFFTFGKEASAEESLQKWFLSLIRKDKKSGEKAEEQKKKTPLSLSPEELLGVIGSFFRQLVKLIRHCRVTRFHLNIVCADEDAADAALNYGRTCAVVYPAYEYINSIIHINKSGEKISIRCDFTKEKTTVTLDTVVRVRVAHIAAAALRLGKDFITLKING